MKDKSDFVDSGFMLNSLEVARSGFLFNDFIDLMMHPFLRDKMFAMCRAAFELETFCKRNSLGVHFLVEAEELLLKRSEFSEKARALRRFFDIPARYIDQCKEEIFTDELLFSAWANKHKLFLDKAFKNEAISFAAEKFYKQVFCEGGKVMKFLEFVESVESMSDIRFNGSDLGFLRSYGEICRVSMKKPSPQPFASSFCVISSVSVRGIDLLRRNPYVFYVSRVLGLSPSNGIGRNMVLNLAVNRVAKMIMCEQWGEGNFSCFSDYVEKIFKDFFARDRDLLFLREAANSVIKSLTEKKTQSDSLGIRYVCTDSGNVMVDKVRLGLNISIKAGSAMLAFDESKKSVSVVILLFGRAPSWKSIENLDSFGAILAAFPAVGSICSYESVFLEFWLFEKSGELVVRRYKNDALELIENSIDSFFVWFEEILKKPYVCGEFLEYEKPFSQLARSCEW
ncbi:hypothetical protein [Candidatus Hydrogenosomobacter endosymbioticus]|uniref:Uncharacterized protein n=1 Tax=Candidatus Hydrogenosomobacter endosymbioticus TaxID=2558174 RepID=A0ABN6L3B2_9PROT|nr:hypothetical protein [Candidatus Hydrogenosomobacter endosymbioticus]BDB96204.1 hypothetical protein HYD_3370 [Candidatus Hydrogenosomobacter endosymbioticus]